MQSIYKILSSRTILTLLFLIVFNIVTVLSGNMTEMQLTIANTVLATIAGYFRINTKVTF